MPTWNAAQYLQFAEERTRPCRELVARITLNDPKQIVDLGCGPGNSTEVLAKRWPASEITGVDHSQAMIDAAAKSAPDGRWIAGDIETWTAPRPIDLVFSNAAMQWVDDHANSFPRLLDQVAAGGALAIQMPANFAAPAHQLMRDLAASKKWSESFVEPAREWFVHEPAFYYDILAPRVTKIDLWTTEYIQVMPDAAAIVEWYKGTGLRPFLDRLDDDAKARFTGDYLERIREAYRPQADGRVLFPFRRLFLIAYR